MCCCGYVFNGRLTYAATGQEYMECDKIPDHVEIFVTGRVWSSKSLLDDSVYSQWSHSLQLLSVRMLLSVKCSHAHHQCLSCCVKSLPLPFIMLQYSIFPRLESGCLQQCPREASKRGQSRRSVSSTSPNPLLSTASMITLHIFFPSCLPV